MRILLFLQRLTFICNILFLICIAIVYTYNFIGNHTAESYVIILGIFFSFLLGLAVNIWEMLLLFNRVVSIVPKWLRMFNLVMFIIQLIYYFIYNDTQHFER